MRRALDRVSAAEFRVIYIAVAIVGAVFLLAITQLPVASVGHTLLLDANSSYYPHEQIYGQPAPDASPASAQAVAPAPTPPSSHSGTSAPSPKVDTGGSYVADLYGTTQGYTAPNGMKLTMIPGSWLGAPSILPVVKKSDGWLEVMLAQRPNGSVAWIPSSAARMEWTPYRIVVSTQQTKLSLYDKGQLVLTVPVGVGTAQDPTPRGLFFVALFAASDGPGYGPFEMITSAHSNAISNWSGTGDAIVAIHGPIGAQAEIGTTGTYVSHGCIRMSVSYLEHFRDIPPGTLVDIV